jgi:hypothetical protein
MTKLGEMLKPEQTEALEGLKSELPQRRLKEEARPEEVAFDHLRKLMEVCARNERNLPWPVRRQLKATVAAVGRMDADRIKMRKNS